MTCEVAHVNIKKKKKLAIAGVHIKYLRKFMPHVVTEEKSPTAQVCLRKFTKPVSFYIIIEMAFLRKYNLTLN